MKHLLFTILIAASISIATSTLFAQSSFSVYAGGNLSKFHLSNFANTTSSPSPGFFVGASSRHHFGNKKWAAGIDFEYLTRASSLEPKVKTGVPQEGIDFKTYSLAALPQIEFLPHKNVGITLGGYASRELKENVRTQGTNTWVSTLDIFKDWDAGLTGGFTLHFGRISGFFRYTHGFVQVSGIEYTNDQGQIIDGLGMRNRLFQAGVGYMIFD